MLTIRWEQMAAFRASAIKHFEDRVVVHLYKCFPNQCRSFGEKDLREIIQHGIGRAAKYGIIAERDVCKYIDFMVVFGRDFDRDANLPWASSVLNDPALNDPTSKIKRLYKASGIDIQGGGGEYPRR